MRFLRTLIPVVFAGVAISVPSAADAGVSIGLSITVAPPILPVYVQPPVPGPNYIWAPGYWAYGEDDYYWVPGTWVLAPRPGLLWTPGYWGWSDGIYFGTPDIGDRTSASTEASTTGAVTEAWVTSAATGTMAHSSTIAPLPG